MPYRFEGETMIPRHEWNRRALVVLLGTCLVGISASGAMCKDKDKAPPLDPNDPTLRFFQTADDSRGGKLSEFYVVADVYRDPALPNEDSQHILKVDYDKAKLFGKLQIVVRSVGKIHPDQMKAYTAKELFEFGLADQAKFMKSEPGPFGRPGDIYLVAPNDRPLSSEPITEPVRQRYATFVSEFLLPAMAKK